MYSLIISVAVALIAGFASSYAIGAGWGIVVGLALYIAAMLLISRYSTKQLKLIVSQVEAIWMGAQEEMSKLANRQKNRNQPNMKLVQQQMQKIVERNVDAAMVILATAEPIYKWNILAEKQINTMRLQLLYQKKDYEAADQYLDKILLADPMTLCMKMARLYSLDRMDEAAKLYKKGAKKFKMDKGVMVYALYSWILLKKGETDKAVEVLDAGKDATEDPVITRNWEVVANGKHKQFSNAGLGDQWYALGLEEPQAQRASKGQMRNNPIVGKGKRRYF